MPRTPNNDRQNDLDDDQVTSRGGNRNTSRDDDGRFASGGTRQTRARNDDDDAGSGRGRGWFGDSEGHAEAGSHSHDHSRGQNYASGPSRSQDYEDDDRGDNRSSGRRRNAEGQFAGNRGQDDDRSREEAEYGAWHAYGHNRGWHGYQRRGNSQANANDRNRDEDGRFTASGRNADYDDDYRNAGSRGNNRNRDEDGRFTGNRH